MGKAESPASSATTARRLPSVRSSASSNSGNRGPMLHAHLLDDVGAQAKAVPSADRPPDRGEPRPQIRVGQQPVHRARQLLVGEPIRVQPDAEPEFVYALGIFVLVPEQR